MVNELALMIPLAPFAIGGLAIWSKHQREMAATQAKATTALTAEKAAQYAAHTERLEERVRVLERIVTDRGSDLAHEIEALRSDAAAPAATPRLPQYGVADPQVTPVHDVERVR